jgi:hypothetical protein
MWGCDEGQSVRGDLLDSLVKHKVHELIETTEDPFDVPVAIQFNCNRVWNDGSCQHVAG